MKKKLLSLLISGTMLFSLVPGCFAMAEEATEAGTEAATEAGTEAAAAEGDGILPEIAGENGTTYVNLFDMTLNKEYQDYWVEKCAEIVGEESAQETADALTASVTATIYGQDAIDAYADSDSMAFDCYFINDAAKFTFEGNQITTTLTDGSEETHTYEYLGQYQIGENETMEYMGEEMSVAFPCDVYQSTDDAGEFTYFFMRDDTMETTWHTEYRYGSSLEDLQGYFTGPYAYWLAAGIDEQADEETIHNVIDLFVTENLGGEE